jgi:hypothetical protein
MNAMYEGNATCLVSAIKPKTKKLVFVASSDIKEKVQKLVGSESG